MRERMGNAFVDMVMSLDGFVAGPNNDDSGRHDWYFAPSGNAVGVIDELLNTIGAMIIGKRSFGDQPDERHHADQRSSAGRCSSYRAGRPGAGCRVS
jgi:hypothetical protein